MKYYYRNCIYTIRSHLHLIHICITFWASFSWTLMLTGIISTMRTFAKSCGINSMSMNHRFKLAIFSKLLYTFTIMLIPLTLEIGDKFIYIYITHISHLIPVILAYPTHNSSHSFWLMPPQSNCLIDILYHKLDDLSRIFFPHTCHIPKNCSPIKNCSPYLICLCHFQYAMSIAIIMKYKPAYFKYFISSAP